MSYPSPNFVPSRPSTPQFSGYPSQLPNRQQCSRSPPPLGPLPPNYPPLYPQSFSSPRRLRSPPPCASPLLHYQQPTTGPAYEYIDSGTCTQGLQYGQQRRHSTGTASALNHCSRILDAELEKPKKNSPAVAALLERVSRYPTKQPDPVPYGLLLHMFQYLYGSMLDSVKFITRDLLRIGDPDAVSCKATVCRFDKRDTWRVYKSRSGAQDHFYCAPHIEVTLPYFPTRAATREVIEAIQDTWARLGRHMQPAYKFRTRTYSWKFEPGMVYESVDADRLIPRLVANEHEIDDNNQEEEQQGGQQDGGLKLITYPDQKSEEESAEMKSGDWPRTLEDVKQEIRYGPNKSQCKETIKSLLANAFGLDIRRIAVWFWVKEVQLNDGKWYPWGSLDNTYGLVIASREVVQYNEEDARRNARRASRSSRAIKEKEPREIAPTLRIVLPVERTNFAKDEENVDGLKECVEETRMRLSAASILHSRAAFCISWKKEKREFADWFAPQVIYKPTGDGDNYVLEGADSCER
ncbi:hypothetical protein F4801DRAFT_551923 [Xylaria longipes]|nr:hypothetical protein F4801DRAFT_551923 [Xylaria longipes]RYC55787.1 hypothetical protein CHU98_g10427 [Xylaria longipes]